MCIAEWSWGSKSKPFRCSSLKLASKSQQDKMRYTFDFAKCDRIFDYLLQEKQIKLPSGHVIPSPEQLKKHAYCKWHNSYFHATNDGNVFHRQVQSAIKEGRLKFAESPQMKLDNNPFPVNMNMVELDGKNGSAISGRDDHGNGGHHWRRMVTEDDQAEKSEGWPMAKE
jgi:hypothetical protein